MSIVVDWNGQDVPEELRKLPAGRYVVESLDDEEALSDYEDEGLRAALMSVARGQGVDADEAERRLGSRARS